MKITKFTILYVHPIQSAKGDGVQRPILLRIDTDEGIYGVGEVGMAYGTGGTAAVGILQDYGRKILGMDPLCNELIFEKLMKTTFWGQGGGTVIFGGMSAIDMALWDIKGKYYNAPVYQLLGGKTNKKLRCYASQTQLSWGPVRKICITPEDYAREALVAVKAGYNAIKTDVLWFDDHGTALGWQVEGPMNPHVLTVAEQRIAAIREAIGPDVDFAIENHAKTDTVAGIQLGRILEKYRIMFYEEPNSTLNPKLTKVIKDSVKVPIASGERIYTRWGYIPFLEDRSIDIIQPDIGTCGGITETKKVSDIAHAYDVRVQVHTAGTAVANAAAIQVETAIPNFCIHEHHQKALMPQYIELCTVDYQPVNGYLEAPDIPGLGQDLSEIAYKKSDIIVVE